MLALEDMKIFLSSTYLYWHISNKFAASLEAVCEHVDRKASRLLLVRPFVIILTMMLDTEINLKRSDCSEAWTTRST
jgi:hypothetical protein